MSAPDPTQPTAVAATNPFCCSDMEPYRARALDHESKFSNFMAWVNDGAPSADTTEQSDSSPLDDAAHVLQLVRQVNFGLLESKHYFAPLPGRSQYREVSEDELINANFQKLNTFKNFKCGAHDMFFELNVYAKDPRNKHHWRADVARPARDIDVA